MTMETMTNNSAKSMDDLVALCKRRGFIFPASEIYGGINGFWDYGPLGTELKNNLRDAWWNDMVTCPPTGPDGEPLSIVGVDSAIIQHPKVWEASGHVAGFNDPMVDDKETKQRFRADHLFALHVWDTDEIGPIPGIEDANGLIRNCPEASGQAVASIVASGVDEAIAMLQSQPKSIPLAPVVRSRLKGVEFAPGDVGTKTAESSKPDVHTGRETASLILRFSDGSKQYATLGPVKIGPINVDEYATPEVVPSPFTGHYGVLTLPRDFNLMFKTFVGAASGEENVAYLRPETAQGIFLNYRNVLDTMRIKVPFGIAQIGKAFRNEVTPRNFIFRSREFEQMEIEFFCPPEDAKKWYEFWCEVRKNWWKSVGLTDANLQMRQHENEELAHYAKSGCGCFDVEYRFPFTAPGFGELEGVADRTDFDLKQHEEHSGAKLKYFDQERNEHYFPYVIEPSGGLSRGVLALLCEAFTPTPERKGSKYIMKFHPRMAPIQAAIFPLVNKDGMPEVALLHHRQRHARRPDGDGA